VLKPAVVTDLAGVTARCRTEPCRRLAAGFADLLAPDGSIPSKNGFDLPRFASIIANLELGAVTKPDRCIWRIAGENVKQRIGINPVGRNYYDFVPEERRQHAMHAMNMVIDVPCGFRAEVEQTYSNGLVRLVEGLALPLASSEPGVDGFIVFADCHVEELDRFVRDRPALQGGIVVCRDLIDLGHGVDETFADLVPG
jgi:hypothetical protein